jgi:hypothetical protein
MSTIVGRLSVKRTGQWCVGGLLILAAALAASACKRPVPRVHFIKAYITPIKPGQCIVGGNVDLSDTTDIHRLDLVTFTVFNFCGQARSLKATVNLGSTEPKRADCVQTTPSVPDGNSASVGCVVSVDASEGRHFISITTGEEGDLVFPKGDLDIQVLP